MGKFRVIILYGLNAHSPPIHVLKGNPQRAGIRRWGPLDGVSPLAGGAPKSQCHLLPPREEMAARKGPSADSKSAVTLVGGRGLWVCGSVGISICLAWSASEPS